jgi:subtilisin family serine protease
MRNKISGILLGLALLTGSAFAQGDANIQSADKIPTNWYQLDASSGYNGISLDKAYSLIQSKNLKSNRVVVAVIDSGIDTLHEDLKPVLWTNPKEIPGNGIDDDHNGYIDDIHGWNFLGGKDGRNVKEDSYEAARVYYGLKAKWENKNPDISQLSASEKNEYNMFLKAKSNLFDHIDQEEVATLRMTLPKMLEGDSVIRKELGKEEYNAKDLKPYSSNNLFARITRSIIIEISKDNNSDDITNKELFDELKGKIRKADAAETPPPSYRKDIVQDDETNINDRNYGNNDIMANTPFHGTHCSGIIAAARNNEKGIDGIADNVSIMMIRAVPDGDEHDKDIANAIRYAVDNGARIISMSFGKDFSPNKQWVDDAFRYAESKGVLLVHAAGNDAKNVDTADNFPNPVYIDGKGRASNVITVGASGNLKNGGLTANFSNYGKAEVDVFAPGVGIYSTIPGGNIYGNASGTSMACPVVAGIAALLLEYYPTFTPQQLKYVIEKSAAAPKEKVSIPGQDEKVSLSEISKTGGIVNAYEAVKLAGSLKTEKPKPVLPKTKLTKTKLG